MTSFNITKNVNKSFSLTIPGYVENPTLFARMSDTITLAVDLPDLTGNCTTTMPIISPAIVCVPTISYSNANGIYTGGITNCSLLTSDSTSFTSTRISLPLGNGSSGSFKTWIPFVVTIAQGTTIKSALITFTDKSIGQQSSPVIIKAGCENSANPSAPTTYNDLNIRVMTTHFTTKNITGWTDGNTYSIDVTTSVQEIISKSTWVSGNTMAILIFNSGSGSGNWNYYRDVYSYGNTTSPISITGISYSGKTVTLTATNTFNIANMVTVAGISSGYSITNVDGTWPCKSGTNASTVVFDVSTQPTGTTPQTSTHGTVTKILIPILLVNT